MKKYFPLLIVILTTFLLSWIFWNKIFLSPNSYMFNPSNDGLKNYYTPAYYIKYDQGVHFSGMNYPYGEHIIFTDNQPVLSLFLNWFSHHIYDISAYTIGILNMLMLLSIFPCVLILYLILRKYGLPFWYSLVMSVFIGFMSPQLLRFSGHYALAYTFYIPLIWLIMLHYFDRKDFIKWGLVLVGVMSLFSLIHPYYLMMALLLGMAYLLIHLMGNRGLLKKNAGFYLKRLLVLWIPFILLKIFLFFTDQITDRPENPYGIFLYQSNLHSVFLPVLPPLNSLSTYLFKPKAEAEGFAYIGIIPLLVLFFTIIKALRHFLLVNFKRILPAAIPSTLKISLWAATLVLIFSFGFPINQFPVLLKIITPLKQFRGLGRFAWIFYYVFTVYAAYYLYTSLRYTHMRSRTIAWYMAGIAFLVWGFEAYSTMRIVQGAISNYHFDNKLTDRTEGYSKLLHQKGLDSKNFQGILALPYFLIGSEKWSIDGSGVSVTEGMKASLNLGIPLTDGMMSRTSLTQTAKLAQLTGGEMIPKEVMKDYKDKRPLLLLISKEKLDSNSRILVSKASFIAETGEVILYNLPLDSILPSYQKINQSFPYEKFSPGELYVSRKTSAVISDGFENFPFSISNFSQGALQKNAGEMKVFKGKINADSSNQRFEISLWVYAKTDSFFPVMIYRQYNSREEKISEEQINPKFSQEIYNNWVRVNCFFILSDKENTIEIIMDGNKIIVDDLLIRPVNVDVGKSYNKDLIFNNYYIPKKFSHGSAFIP